MRFFERYDKWPFVIGEYGPWDNDFGGSFTGSLLRWVEAHDRVKMVIYYRGVDPDNEYNLQFYPGAASGASQPPAKPRWDRVRAWGEGARRSTGAAPTAPQPRCAAGASVPT